MRFTVLSGPDAGRTQIIRGNAGVIGRGPDTDVPLADSRVSRAHAVVESSDSGSTVRDLGSTNGVFLRGMRLDVGIPAVMQPGDELRLGDTVLRYEGVGGLVPAHAEAGSSLAVPRIGSGSGRNPLFMGAAAGLLLVTLVLLWWRPWQPPPSPSPAPKEQTGATETIIPPTATLTLLPPVVILTPGTVAVDSTVTPADTPEKIPPAVTPTDGQNPGIGSPTPASPAVPVAGNQTVEQLPAVVALLFPGVPLEQLPQAITNAVRNGELSPDQMRSALNALFPGVSPRDLPVVLARTFPSVPVQLLQQILEQAFAGQGLSIPSIPPMSGIMYVGVFSDGRYQIIEVNTQNNAQKVLIDNASEPALSPDRQWLAYYSWRNDTRGLRLYDLASGTDKPLTDRAQDAYPSWSPNQDRLAFHDSQDGTVVTINRDGTDRRAVGKGEFAAWSPKGDVIAYKGCLAGGDCGLILARPDGAERQRLTTDANDGQPAWSPDGNSLTFVSNRDGNWEIYAVNRDGSWLRRITIDDATDGLPEFSPDGLRIAFRSDRQGTWAVWAALGLGGPAIKLFDANAGPSWQYERISWR